MGWDYLAVRPPVFPADAFAAWVEDVRRVAAASSVSLHGPDGTGEPLLTPDRIAFNGDKGRIHTTVIPASQTYVPVLNADESVREWVKGEIIPEHLWEREESALPCEMARVAHPASSLWEVKPRDLVAAPFIEHGWINEPFLTQYLPYDEVVTAALALLSDRFPRHVVVHAHGVRKNWDAGLALVARAIGRQVRLPAYKHRWRLKTEYNQMLVFAPEDVTRWCADMQRVVAATDIPLAGPGGTGEPILTDTYVAFNGVGDDTLGPFAFPPQSSDWQAFGHHATCITGQRPYDTVVTAALTLLAHHLPDTLIVRPGFLPGEVDQRFFLSHGIAEEWEPGRTLAQEATGRELAIPLN